MKLELIKKEEDREVVERAENFFEPLHRGHSHFQIEHFILNEDDFPLPDDKYYQAMLETYGRYENLISQHYEYRKLNNEIRLLEVDKLELKDTNHFSEGRKAILIEMKQDEIIFKKFQMRNIERSVKDTCREMKSFLICMDKVKDKMKYKSYEEKEKHHWLLRYHIQKKKGERTCSIPEEMLLGESSKKLLEGK